MFFHLSGNRLFDIIGRWIPLADNVPWQRTEKIIKVLGKFWTNLVQKMKGRFFGETSVYPNKIFETFHFKSVLILITYIFYSSWLQSSREPKTMSDKF